MRKLVILFIIILGILSCGNPQKAIKQDLKELKAVLEKMQPEIKELEKKAEERYDKQTAAMPKYLPKDETEQQKKDREAKLKELWQQLNNELAAEKTPDTREARKVLEKMKKNVSKIKAKNQAEMTYYYYINELIKNTEDNLNNIDNFGENVKKGYLLFGIDMSGIIYTINQLENFPI